MISLFNPDKYSTEECKKSLNLIGCKTLMFPGPPRPYKGLEDLLKALELIGNTNYKLVIVGGNPYDDYDKVLTHRWGQWIINLPSQQAHEMPAVIMAADLGT